jgi:osmotically-inducible protein OsmY
MARKFVAASLMIGTAILCLVFRRSSAHEYSSAASKMSVAQGAGSPSAANAELEEAVNSMLRSDNQLRKATLKVEAEVTKNEVTLSGTVESEAIRAKAVELTKAAHVGVVVNDRIAVRPDRQSNGE